MISVQVMGTAWAVAAGLILLRSRPPAVEVPLMVDAGSLSIVRVFPVPSVQVISRRLHPCGGVASWTLTSEEPVRNA